jgi:hypothetical protein
MIPLDKGKISDEEEKRPRAAFDPVYIIFFK